MVDRSGESKAKPIPGTKGSEHARKTVIVTGSARGIGKAIALRLAKSGFDVCINDISANDSQCKEVVKEIESVGRKAIVAIADVRDQSQVEQMVKSSVDALGPLSVMIANAGIAQIKKLLDVTTEDFDNTYAVNVRGVFNCYSVAAKQMISQGTRGKLIAATSIAAFKAGHLLGPYSASKWAVRGLNQAFAMEMAEHGITANSFAPGIVDTAMWDYVDEELGKLEGKGASKGEIRERTAKELIALGRTSQPEDVAGLVNFLAGEDSDYITGQCQIVDGGVIFTSPCQNRTISGYDKTQHETQFTHKDEDELIGDSGRHYLIERVLQSKEVPLSHVYLTSCDDKKFVVKSVLSDFEHYRDMQRALGNSRYLRLLQDTIPDKSMFVFKYLKDHLLFLAQKDLPLILTKRILKDVLRGIAELHHQNIVHTDIKPNNVLVQWSQTSQGIFIDEVRLGDLEDSAYVPPGKTIRGKQVGNQNWRSPEAHAEGPVNKPSDMFSFGIMCIYAVLKRVILYVDEQSLPEGELVLAHILERQISYFADLDSLCGLMKYLGDSLWCQVLQITAEGFNKENPREPFSLWKMEHLDSDFKDLIAGLPNFDPAKRFAADEALSHVWFQDV